MIAMARTTRANPAAAPITERMPAWIEPQLAALVKAAPDGDAWLHEIKLDGYRMHARLEEAVAAYTSHAAEKLRGQGLAANRITVFAHTNRFKPEDAQYAAQQPVTLPVASADTGKLIAAAKRGLGAIWRPGYRYKKAGIMLLDLVPAASVQGALFDRPDTARSRARMRAVDALNRHFGRDTMSFAASGRRRGWKLRSEFISPRFTTDWDELLRV
jgi:DNA polymerase V